MARVEQEGRWRAEVWDRLLPGVRNLPSDGYSRNEQRRFGQCWRINGRFDYWPNSGRVLDRIDPKVWIQGRVASPDELAHIASGAQKLKEVRVTRRATSRHSLRSAANECPAAAKGSEARTIVLVSD